MIIESIDDLVKLIENNNRDSILDAIIETAKSFVEGEFTICVEDDGILTDGDFEYLMNELGIIIDWTPNKKIDDKKCIMLSAEGTKLILPLIEVSDNHLDTPDYYCLPNKILILEED